VLVALVGLAWFHAAVEASHPEQSGRAASRAGAGAFPRLLQLIDADLQHWGQLASVYLHLILSASEVADV
jgi:hypothetical protein